jgi:hypothetical protein
MASQSSSRRSVKPRPKPERHVHLYDGVPALLEMTIGKQSFAYWLSEIPDGAGRGFEVRKMSPAGQEPSADVYHVHVDDHGHHSCDCPGGEFHGHCKHLDCILTLIKSGKLPQATAKPASKPEVKPAPVPESKPADKPAKREPWCEQCNDDPAVYCSHCSI